MRIKLAAPILPCTLAVLSLGSCVSEPVPATSGGNLATETLLSFPDGKYLVETSIILYEVKIFLEMSREPLKGSGGFPLETPMFGPLPGPGERYRAGYPDATGRSIDPSTAHEFSFEAGKFLVDEFRYPSARYAHLYILQERSGPLVFNFRDRLFAIEMNRPWKPAVLYRPVREEEELPSTGPTSGRGARRPPARQTITRLLREEVQAGPHRIIALPDTNQWQVNQYEVGVPPGAAITINRRGDVTVSP